MFGEVGEGLETLMRINGAFVDEKDRPYKNIRYVYHPLILVCYCYPFWSSHCYIYTYVWWHFMHDKILMFCIPVTYPNGTLHKTDAMMWSRIKHTTILDDPFDDPAGLADLIPDKSPELRPPAEVNTVTDSIFVISFFQ